ncbi:uncharacterized protein N0V89_003454 [Didymosphaeria variabile]|uniref:Uncharacterized protein n=1 Tax=Didymosphaeria variabile TaxID=1932322 RepID=A0A9W8XMN6_9PLEO|nr:uncharacterized protein N0V89_003454 [Didymosphaeria variabile]KAJ4355438.1 hypothetical protein N0V89_003454 [Didymosphaeria variabile]
MSAILASFLLASAVNAKVLPREVDARSSTGASASILPIPTVDPDSSSITDDFPTSGVFPTSVPFTSLTDVPSPSLSSPSPDFSGTIFIGIPPQADYTTTTVSACTQADGEVVDSLVVIGVPTGTFSPGLTKTIVVPPQADPTTVTYYDTPPSNATEVIIIEPLPGNCGPFITPTGLTPGASTTSASASPSNTAGVCPTKGCSGAILRTAETVINALNAVTQASMNLQRAAKKIGAPPVSPLTPHSDASTELFSNPISDVAIGLSRIVISVQTALPSFNTFPAFPPGCSSDTIVLAWLEFVRVHQELLAILIGRSGLLETGPVRRSEPSIANTPFNPALGPDGAVLVGRETQGFIGKPIAVALRGIEAVVDTLAVGVVDLVPGKSACSEEKGREIKASIKKAEVSYEG